ncbi:RNA polymerase sigma-70 factor, ECF subfamily [Parapedobacter luteus]|uniref:RNA polymerase sigma-70 factor, ECF subfamily n=1 Tax=Parapedobacter luteus TaxID=623280 RepID=A0A1T5D1L4_9SPHI|nr:RNA polymerase sigma-70 factor [Parapedobacter luteus]SKB65527.1 RNA polymerase sigma-70 factor, ECF subfamily [Parapedobacter luteus]
MNRHVTLDEELLKRLKKGDQDAYAFLYKEYYVLLCAYAFKFVHDHLTSESIVNDVVYTIWKNRENLMIEKTLRSYLVRAVKNRCINHLNQQKLQQTLRDQILLEHSFVNNENSFEKLILRELEDRLESALRQLPELTETIFRKSRFEQLRYQEIADELKVSIDVVKYHIKSALSALRVALKDFLFLLLLLNFF